MALYYGFGDEESYAYKLIKRLEKANEELTKKNKELTEQLRLCGVVKSLPVLDRCECLNPDPTEMKICVGCDGYVE